MTHSFKDHLEVGKIIVNSKGVIGFKARNTGRATSFCKRANSNLNGFLAFSKISKDNGERCKTCEKAFNDLVAEVKRLRELK